MTKSIIVFWSSSLGVQVQLSLSGVENGVYFLNVSENNSIVKTSRVVISK
ncbi:MAG: hypothetical protein ACK5AY_05905 [Bacteroidota bacterium]